MGQFVQAKKESSLSVLSINFANRIVYIFTIAILHLIPYSYITAQTNVNIISDKVTTIYQGSGGNDNFGNSAVMQQESYSTKTRCLIQFNLSTIPANATISSATLRIVKTNSQLCDNSANTGSTITFSIRRLTQDWIEGTGCNVTGNSSWINSGFATWSGGVFDATSYGSITASASAAAGTVYTSDVLSLVNYWRSNPSMNFGLIFVNTSADNNSTINFWADEALVSDNRPRLEITYTIPPPTITTNITNVTCNGGSNGAVSLTVSGGNPPYTYLWSNGATTQNISGLSAGSYTVTVTNTGGGSASSTAVVTQPAILNGTVSKADVTCFGSNNGTITISAPSGGSGSYQYRLNTGTWQASGSFTGLSPATYSVQIRDANNPVCERVLGSQIVIQPGQLNGTVSKADVTCFGSNNGTITISAPSGGSGSYQYRLNTGAWQASGSFTGLSPNTYSVQIRDANNPACEQVLSSQTVTQPLQLNATVSKTDINCFGDNTGTITVSSPSGGSGSYQYRLNTGAWQASGSFTGLVANTYSVQIRDANNPLCERVLSSQIVSQPGQLTATVSKTDITCTGNNNGTITVSAPSGGSGTYQYRLNIGTWQSSGSFTGLPLGSYLVQIRDANNTTCFREIGTQDIDQPSALVVSGLVTNVSCFGGNNGSIIQTVSGGTGPYSYAWSGGGSTSKDRSGLTFGVYSVTITDSGGCSATRSYNVSQPGLLSINANVNQPECGIAGSILISMSGGVQPYSFNWSDLAGSNNPQNRSNLSGGSYGLTVTDANGCTAVGSYLLDTPDCGPGEIVCIFGNTSAVYSVTPDPFVTVYNWTVSNGGIIVSGQGTPQIVVNWTSATPGAGEVCVTSENDCGESTESCKQILLRLVDAQATADPACTGGDLELFATGGATGDQNYVWSGPGGFVSNIQNPVLTNVTNANSGVYTVTVTDDVGCTATASVTVVISGGFTIEVEAFNAECGQNIGAVQLTITGGSFPFSYIWNTGATTEFLDDLPGGNYSVTVTDADGCVRTAVASVGTFDGPDVTSVSTNVTCNGGNNGTVTLTVSGGTSPYSYLWSNGATTQNISGLVAGLYAVTVVDAGGCVAATSRLVNQPNPFQINISRTNLTCNGSNDGTISLAVQGGTSPYSYTWSNGGPSTPSRTGLASGAYSMTVTDANGCSVTRSVLLTQPAVLQGVLTPQGVRCAGQSNGAVNLSVSGGTAPYSYLWSNNMTSKDISGVQSGGYSVTVTDSRGCSIIRSTTVGTPAALVLSHTKVDIQCNGGSGGSIDLSVSGGTGPYTYVWSNGSIVEDPGGLIAGGYTVTVSDSQGCTASRTVSITEPTQLTVDLLSDNIQCRGLQTGTINVNVSGGTGSYTYMWSDIGIGTSFRSGLGAGTYGVTVTDGNGCTDIESTMLTEPSDGIGVNVLPRGVSCFGGNDGQILLNVSGGTPDYSYSWTGPGGFTAMTKDITGRGAGQYNVTVTDANGCTLSQTNIDLSEPAQLILSGITTTEVSCFGGTNGSITMTITGGTTPYNIVWSNGMTTEDISGLSAGTYNVIVIDGEGCTVNGSGTVGGPSQGLSIGLLIDDILCSGDANGVVTANVSGGTPDYSYSWSFGGAGTSERSGLSAGNYNLTVTDMRGCTSVRQFTIEEGESVQIVGVSKDVLCHGGTNGSISLTVNGGYGGYSYSWSDGLPGLSEQTGLGVGSYSVTVTDALGCTGSGSYTIGQPAILTAIGTAIPALCYESKDGIINLSVAGGVSPYTYEWSSGVNTEDAFGLSAGMYTVTVTDTNLCSTTASFTVTEPGELRINSIMIPNCAGQSNGSVALSVSGGTGGYSYSWTGVGSGSNPRTGLGSGVYFVTVTDANGCIAKDSFELIPLQLELVGNDRTCLGNDGFAIASATGGLIPYSYLWNNGVTENTIKDLSQGTYFVTVTAGTCTRTGSIQIGVPSECAPPVAQDDVYSTPMNTPLTGTVMPTDPMNPGYDFDPFYALEDLTFENLEGLDTLIGTIEWDSIGGFVFTPVNGYTGTFSLDYEICNPLGLCDRATLTITVLGPDVTPVITALPNVMQGITDFNITVRVTELNNAPTNGLIVVRIPKDVRLSFKAPYDPGKTMIGSTPVSNGLWSFSENGTHYIFSSTAVIGGGSFSTFGFEATFDPGAAKGVYTITSQIDSFSGGEIRIDNNVDSERLDYFIE